MDALNILEKVNSFYSSAWNILIVYTAVLIGIVGIILPIVLQLIQTQKYRLDKRELVVSLQKELDEWKKNIQQKVIELVSENITIINTRFLALEASLDRAFASISKDTPEVSFIWWIRAAHKFFLHGNNVEFTRISLESAYENISKLKNKIQISDSISEINELLKPMRDSDYKREVALIDKEIERIYYINNKTV